MTQVRKFLQEIIQHSKSSQQQGLKTLAVFDLDSTLFDVLPRVQQILIEFAKDPAIQARFPEVSEILHGIQVHRKDWGVQEALHRAGLADHKDLGHVLRDYWQQRFFSNEYLEYDLPYDGAVSFVQELAAAGAQIAYLTGRDVARMGVGTSHILKKWGFPVHDKAVPALKPHKEMDDAFFKVKWFAAQPLQQFSKVWFFENEPLNIHMVRRAFPQVEMVFIESTHSGRAPEPTDVPRILHFLMDDLK